MAIPFDLSLYLITDARLAGPRGVVETVRQAISGGVTLVQLRDPDASTRSLIATAEALLDVLRPHGIPLIINDRVDVALAVGAEGVHVGQSDMPTDKVRALIGPDRILGLSTSTFAQVAGGDLGPADYLGIGPLFATPTKTNASTPIGFDGLAELVARAPLPVVAIGGIKPEHVERALAAGADGVSVVSAIMAAEDPAQAARDFAERIERYRAQ